MMPDLNALSSNAALPPADLICQPGQVLALSLRESHGRLAEGAEEQAVVGRGRVFCARRFQNLYARTQGAAAHTEIVYGDEQPRAHLLFRAEGVWPGDGANDAFLDHIFRSVGICAAGSRIA